MATTTTNLGLTKPAYADDADIAVINGNMDILDTKIGAVGNTDLQSQVTTLNSKIRTITSGSLHDIKTSGVYYLTGAVTDKPVASGGLYVVSAYSNSVLVGMYADLTYGNQYTVMYDGTNWSVNSLFSNIAKQTGSVTFGTGIEAASASETVVLTKSANTVCCSIAIKATQNVSAQTVVFTLSDGYKPSGYTFFVVMVGNTPSYGYVDSNGNVRLGTAINSGAKVYGSVSFGV